MPSRTPEAIGRGPEKFAIMPEIREEKDLLLKNLAPGRLPTDLDLAISTAMVKRM